MKEKIRNITSALIVPFREFPYLPRWMVLLLDVCISMFAFTFSYLICYQLQHAVVITNSFILKLILNTIITSSFFLIFRTYIGIIRYSTFMDGLRVFFAVFCACSTMLVISNVVHAYTGKNIFFNIGFALNFVLTFFMMFTFRMFVKLSYDFLRNDLQGKKTKLLIYDVTPSIVSLARMIKNSTTAPYRIVGFISPDSHAVDKTILGAPVYAKDATKKIKSRGAKFLLINPTELDRKTKQELSDFCLENKIQMISPPPLSEWKDGAFQLNKMKNIQIEDLLGRVPIQICVDEIGRGLDGKCVMVTGAAGSIGSEIVRQLGKFNPALLLLCDIAETPLHYLQLEIQEKYPSLNFIPLISDIRNYDRMQQVFETYRPHHVYHAAAYKHVPLMENHPSESVRTNIFGTKNVADLAIRFGAEVLVQISTDKAVNPTNVMGASKRIAEIYVQSLFNDLKKQSKTNDNSKQIKIITTRFGNVLGSNGSVIPRFKEQIEKGGPVTVTHPDIIRYFMTIPEACRLVLEAGNMGKGGEIFVFDMGDPVKIKDLAEKMIRLAGYIPYKEIDIKYTGLRPGEKLYEELLAQEETTQPTYNKKIMIGSAREYDYNEVCAKLNHLLEVIAEFKDKQVVQVMKELVPEFVSANSTFEVLDKKKEEIIFLPN